MINNIPSASLCFNSPKAIISSGHIKYAEFETILSIINWSKSFRSKPGFQLKNLENPKGLIVFLLGFSRPVHHIHQCMLYNLRSSLIHIVGQSICHIYIVTGNNYNNNTNQMTDLLEHCHHQE